MKAVQRVSSSDGASLARRLEEVDAPLVIEGAVAHWPAVSRWTPGYLSELLVDVEVACKLSSSNAHPDFRRSTPAEMFAREKLRLSSLVERMTTGPRNARARRIFTGDEQFLVQRRAGVERVDPALAPLLADLGSLAFVPDARLYTVWAWFSGPGVRTWLHYDNNGCHNANAQLRGDKVAMLFPPSELPRLYPFPHGGANPAHNCCAVDVDAPDLARFPDYAGAAWLEAELHAGDVLFIPAFWLHAFRHDGDFNANVNYWWKPERPRKSAVSERQALLDLLASSDADPAERAAAERALSDAEMVR